MQIRTEDVLTLVALSALLVGCLLVLAPFLSSVLWAVVICFSTWGVYERVLRAVGGRPTLAALLMTLALASVLLGPLVVVGTSIGSNSAHLASAVQNWVSGGPHPPPDWVVNLPIVGERLRDFWAAFDLAKLVGYVRQMLEPLGRFALGTGLALGQGLLYLGLSVLVSFFLYRDGTEVAARVRAGMERIAGARAHHLLEIAGNTVIGVVQGIIGTAIAQGVLAGIGFRIAGVPGPILLGLITCVLALVPMGPPLIWIPAAAWLFHEGHPYWALFMAAWGAIAISGIDNVLRPYLISQGSRLPFILVLLGVLGGIIKFGIIGVFLGPTLLAVGYALLTDWTRSRAETRHPSTPAPPTARVAQPAGQSSGA
jgi:predicted PurR-regulated permease PerM